MLGWNIYGCRPCYSAFFHSLFLFAGVAATWLPFNNSGSSLHAWLVLFVTFSHLITSASLCKWSKVCKELQHFTRLANILGREGRVRRRGCVSQSFSIFLILSTSLKKVLLLSAAYLADFLRLWWLSFLLFQWCCVKLVWTEIAHLYWHLCAILSLSIDTYVPFISHA